MLLASALVPFVTAALRAIATGWFPIGDSALLYLRAVDVGTRHHPWLGSWSSASISLGYDINNPGPLYADLIAPFAHLFSPGVGNALGVTVLNAACFVGAVVAARRIGGWRFERWVLVAGAALAWTMGSELLFDIFQAHALLFPFLLALVLMVGVMNQVVGCWPWLVAVLSLILQTHISYAYIVALLVATAVAVATANIDASGRALPRVLASALASRTAAWCAGVGAVLWAQSIGEQVFGEGRGNLSRLASSAGGTDVTVGWANATRLVGATAALPPWWTRWGFADTIRPAGTVELDGRIVLTIPGLPGGAAAAASLAVLVALLVLVLVGAHRAGDRVLVAVAALALTGVVGGVAALSRLTVGPVGLAPHHTRWMIVVALLAHVTLAWALVDWLAGRLPDPAVGRRLPRWVGDPPADRVVVAVIAVAVVVLSAANVPKYAQQHGPADDAHTMPAMRRLFAELERLAPVAPVRYRTDNLRVYEPYSSAVHLQLQARGIEFRVTDESLLRQLGTSRRADGTEPATVAQFEAWTAFAGDLPGCVLVRASALDAAGERAIQRTADDLVGRLDAARRSGRLDVSAVFTADGAREADHLFADRVAAGDPDALREITYDGRLDVWFALGWASGPPDLVADLHREAPAITSWLSSVVALTVSPAEACGR